MPIPILNAFSLLTVALNRILARVDRWVRYISGYILYLFFRGLKPQTHTRPYKTKDGRFYSPAVVITGASEGELGQPRCLIPTTRDLSHADFWLSPKASVSQQQPT
jgi:hypothetical protein